MSVIINFRDRLRELLLNHPGKLSLSSEKKARDYLSRVMADEFARVQPPTMEPYIGDDGQIHYRKQSGTEGF